MSELSAEEREALVAWWESDWPDTRAGTLGVLAETVEAILTARLASRDARLAAVEALAGGYHEDAQCEVLAMPASLARRAVYLRVSGDISAALHPDPSEASTNA